MSWSRKVVYSTARAPQYTPGLDTSRAEARLMVATRLQESATKGKKKGGGEGAANAFVNEGVTSPCPDLVDNRAPTRATYMA